MGFDLQEAVERALKIEEELQTSRDSLCELQERVQRETGLISDENSRLQEMVCDLEGKKGDYEERLAKQRLQLDERDDDPAPDG